MEKRFHRLTRRVATAGGPGGGGEVANLQTVFIKSNLSSHRAPAVAPSDWLGEKKKLPPNKTPSKMQIRNRTMPLSPKPEAYNKADEEDPAVIVGGLGVTDGNNNKCYKRWRM